MPHKLFSKNVGRSKEPYVRPTLSLVRTESIDTNATASNIPGPGRNVGRLYDTLGAKLENYMGKTPGNGPGNPSFRVEANAQPVLDDDAESIASDATGPNNPGPGRNLGRLYDALGAKFESFLIKRAVKLNNGPDALARKIRNLRRYREAFILGDRGDKRMPITDKELRTLRENSNGLTLDLSPTAEDIRILKKLCRNLLKHCKWVPYMNARGRVLNIILGHKFW